MQVTVKVLCPVCSELRTDVQQRERDVYNPHLFSWPVVKCREVCEPCFDKKCDSARSAKSREELNEILAST